MTLARLLAELAAALPERPGLPDARREARALAAAACARSEAWLLAHGDEPVEAALVERLRGWCARRAAGEPLHRITARCPFWGRDFALTPDVLVPRPETELLVAEAVGLAVRARPRVLDVGTGSGCIAVTLALELPAARVLATDLSPAALATARRNATRLGARVMLAASDLATAVTGGFDVVTANLPYVPGGEIGGLAIEVREWEPRLALDGGPDGTALVLRLVAELPRLLTVGGTALLELGPGQADFVAKTAAGLGLAEAGRSIDVNGVERVVALRRV